MTENLKNTFLSKHQNIALLFMAVLTFIVYSNTFNAPFVLDDYVLITNNPHVRLTDLTMEGLMRSGFNSTSARPFAMISFAFNYYFHTYKLMGYHLVNIFIHITTGILFYFLIKTTLSEFKAQSSKLKAKNLEAQQQSTLNPTFIAFFAALIWLVHPVQIQSVTYIIQRMNSMAAMFYVLSLLLYAKGRIVHIQEVNNSQLATHNSQPVANLRFHMRSTLCYTGSLFAGIVALGSKEIAATLPFFILLYEWYFFQKMSVNWLRRHFLLFTGICILFLLMAFIYFGGNPIKEILSGYHSSVLTLNQRVFTEIRVVIFYISLLLFPHPARLNLDHDFPLSHSLIEPITTLISFGGIVFLFLFALNIAKKERLISFCILWFLGNLVIESSVIGIEIIYEHRIYLPSMFIILMTVIFVNRYVKRTWLKSTLLCTLVCVCSAWTYERNSIWSDRITLWSDCVKKSPNLARPHDNLGGALLTQGKVVDAMRHFQDAMRIDPNDYRAHHNMGVALEKQGKFDEAIEHYFKALSIKPDFEEAYNNLGNNVLKQGKLDEAIKYYSRVLYINPELTQAHYNLGLVLLRKGNNIEAIDSFSKALKLDPGLANAYNNWGVALLREGEIDKAIAFFQKALQIQPDLAQAYHNLESVLATKDK